MQIDKPTLIYLAEQGNKAGFNRQLDPARLRAKMRDEEAANIRFSFVHHHIAGERVDPHVRLVTSHGVIDMSFDDYNKIDKSRGAPELVDFETFSKEEE